MGRPFTVGVLSPMSGGFYFGAIIDGINRAAARVGGRTVVLQTIDPDRYEEPDTTLRSGPFALPVAWSHLDGMVVISGAVRLPYLQRLRAAGVPIVQVSHEFPDFAAPIVKPDNMGGIALAVTHLIEHGHRSIAFAGNLAQDDIRERYEGYQSALRSHGIEPDEKLFFPTTDNMIRGGRDAGQALLTSASPATAIVAATDTNALGILEALREAGRSVPDDLAVTGFDNVEEAAVNTPALTTVSVPFGRLGELATSLVLEYRNGAPVADLVYTGPASLMIRQSCGCGRASARTTPASAAGELAEGLRVLLLPDQTPPAETSRRFEAALTGVMGFFSQAAGPATPDHASTAAVAARLHAFANRCETRRQVVELLHRYVTTAAGADPAVRTRMDAALLRLTLELADAESHAQSRLQVETERRMAAVYDIGMVLLRSDEEDPSTMVWLGRTGAPAGCLGLWADGDLSPGDALRIVGVHGSPLDRLRDTRVPVDRFPPEPLLARADASTGQIVYAVPVAVAGSHWGMLAAVGTVDTHSSNGGSEAFNHLGGLLAVALEQLRQRSNLISGYQRERELAEELRRSEERYALSARASNDGLWDWDLTSDTIFYSDRWIMTIGHRPGELGPSPKEWLSRVHADDRDALDKAIAACRSGDTLLLEHGHRIRTGTGSYRWMLCRALAVHDAEGNAARLVGSLTDIDDQRKLEEHLRYAASYDSLTGLSNRRHFLERLDAAVAAAAASSGQEFAVLYCDLDGFKAVNDRLGHLVGDQLLIGVADRISSSIRATDLGARLGGDEFAVLLTAVTPGELEQVTGRLQQAIAEPFVLEGHTVTVGVSIGTSFGDAGPAAASEVLRRADAAMYRIKQARRQGRGLHPVR